MRVAMLDIDSTLTGNASAAGRVRSLLERREDVVVFNTSRTEEMVMTSSSFASSRARTGFTRPPPRLGMRDGRRVEVPQEAAEPAALLDPDVIAGSTGTRILFRQSDGRYRPDGTYGAPNESPPDLWRHEVLALLARVNDEGRVVELASIENADNYRAGRSDVFPPDYRVQVNFAQPQDRLETVRRLAAIRRTSSPDNPLSRRATRIRVLDDSEPRHGRYKAFIIPRWASKARAAYHILSIVRECARDDASIDVLFVGDSYPDLHMGLLGGVGLRCTLLLAGGSRLTDVLTVPGVSRFAGDSLAAVKRRLTPTGQPGRYRYRVPCGRTPDVQIVIGDAAFPGSTAVETVARYLEAG